MHAKNGYSGNPITCICENSRNLKITVILRDEIISSRILKSRKLKPHEHCIDICDK